MRFELSEDQQLIKESLGRLLEKHYSFERRKGYQNAAEGWSREVWQQYADLGLLALPFDERHGGLSGTPVETMLVMELFGRVIALEPYLATVILAGGIVRHAGSDAQKERLVAAITAGSTTLALAHEERDARYDLAHVGTAAKPDGDGWRLDGQKCLVLHGDTASKLIVSARVAGKVDERQGIALFLVDAASTGVDVRPYPTQDGQRAADISLTGVRVAPDDVIGTPGAMYPAIQRAYDEAIAALCAEAVGAMAMLHELTVDYLKQRRQFGVPIGSFQALQHRAAEMFMALEQARSMAMFAAIMAADADDDARGQAISAAKVQIGRSARFIGEQAVQMHGGIAMAMECSAGHYFKRLTTIDRLMGDADHHLALVAQGESLFDRE
jgi:pimeloyl-CoA dehydrogenase small subunit